MDYLTVKQARERAGMKLVLTKDVPGPWSEAAKSIFFVKKIDYLPVGQIGGGDNEDLVSWTGTRNAPIAIWGDDQPRSGWSDILMLAERIAPAPPLVPEAPAERVTMLGLSQEICGEGGFGWTRRLMLLAPLLETELAPDDPGKKMADTLGRAYGYTTEAARAAPSRCAQILELLDQHLASQAAAGSRYLVGETLSAVDIYWACFAAIVAPMSAERCPISDMMRGYYSMPDPTIQAALSPQLLAHRDFIYDTHLQLPMDF